MDTPSRLVLVLRAMAIFSVTVHGERWDEPDQALGWRCLLRVTQDRWKVGAQASSLCLSCEPGWDAGLWWELGRREIRTFREGPLSVPGFGPLLILGKLGVSVASCPRLTLTRVLLQPAPLASMDPVARESVSVNREPPATLSAANASAPLASMASSARRVSVRPPPNPCTLSSSCLIWGWEHGACRPHQGASQAFLETAASSNVTARKGCPVIPPAASAFAHWGVQEPHVTWVSGGSCSGWDLRVGLHQ